MKHIYLRPMLEWRVEMDHDWKLPVGSLGKGLKRHLPADIWTCLERSYAGAHIADNWRALRRTMELFRRVSVEVGAYFGYAYPEELHRKVIEYIEQIRQLGNLKGGN